MNKIDEALDIIKSLGLPKEQHNERTALCLLALINLKPDGIWKKLESPLIGITPMMEFAKKEYGIIYAPNTRETFRRYSIHQLVDAGITLLNPDDTERPINSPKTVYQIETSALELIKKYGTKSWNTALKSYLKLSKTLSQRYANERDMNQIPVRTTDGIQFKMSPGTHSQLIKSIIEEFAPRFVPNATLIYVGDTGDKWGYFDDKLLEKLGVQVNLHGKMPDIILYFPEKNWLLLIESVTSHGPVNGKRHEELARLFNGSDAPIVYVTAFPSRSVMSSYTSVIAWETEVWCADAPTHLIHFNGSRFLGPYPVSKK